MTEETIVKDIIAALRKTGCSVLRMGANRRRHSNCTPGTPDLFVRRPHWPSGFWQAMEAKTDKGKLTEEQQKLHEVGAIVLVRSVDDALEAVRLYQK